MPEPTPVPLFPTAPTTGAPTLPLVERLAAIIANELPDGGEDFLQSLVDPTSPQSKALTWLAQNSRLWSYDMAKMRTRFALANFYYSTDGDNWTENSNWISDSDECTWYAANLVAPCIDREYARLVLGDNNLRGTLPYELSLLSNSLTKFDIGGVLSGQIPIDMAELTRLELLRIHGNTLSGLIPASFIELTALTHLELSRSSLTGSVSPQLLRSLTNLEVLDLSRNQLTGLLSSDIANLQKLTDLSLQENGLRGAIPFEIGNLKNLEILRLDDNRFSLLPRNVGVLSNLELLSIRNNDISGTLPTVLGSLRNLKVLYLNNNNFASTIPSQLGALTNLVDGLDLSSNELTGQVPSEFGLLTGLSKYSRIHPTTTMLIFTLDCRLTTASLFSLAENLMLRNNQLRGTLPTSLGNILSLCTFILMLP
jgi:hypothetical protein